MWDVAIIGAGLTGLTCARQLKAAGLTVCVLDKSRGLGGRMATRRVETQDYGRAHQLVRVDHGLRYWQPAAALQPLTDELIAANVLRPWNVSAYELHKNDVLVPIESQRVYAVEAGMSAVAKHLASGLIPDETLLSDHRAIALTPDGNGWRIECEDQKVVMAQRCAIAIPASQAADLLEARLENTYEITSLSDSLNKLRTAEYDPCLTVIAGYGSQTDMGKLDPNGWMVTDIAGSSTDWAALDSSKRDNPVETVIVIHSKPAFAQRYIDTSDLQPAASVLLRANARKFCAWIAQPEWFQIHRWRYAQVRRAYLEPFVALTPSLVAGGDWCSSPAAASPNSSNSRHIEAAYLSGLAMAEALQRKVSYNLDKD
ncbi:NAD(P)/FAD-dependent oxidoreductase [cf. Phormidesmis sp. LEGE 11477]|uniref:NAD(P)/FAD-dependent oxidoreductase n=1 Tax=cf. Phormidesmis sp. LEGE 11477 TaxID=1828680 RepID=UPI00187EC45D|nr:FAD-dependent oxidoreductase [cf. Phormidesmis sp. LEGE 11477]MBE9064199.1 FAD-dependent oxidoreductase [cf. Phormidesmis sp. LEGE 11477]